MTMRATDKQEHVPDDCAQLIPAAGWFAEYSDDENGGTFIEPLLAWALTYNADVVGLVAGGSMVGACTDDANFLRYVHERDLDRGRDPKDEDTDNHHSVRPDEPPAGSSGQDK